MMFGLEKNGISKTICIPQNTSGGNRSERLQRHRSQTINKLYVWYPICFLLLLSFKYSIEDWEAMAEVGCHIHFLLLPASLLSLLVIFILSPLNQSNFTISFSTFTPNCRTKTNQEVPQVSPLTAPLSSAASPLAPAAPLLSLNGTTTGEDVVSRPKKVRNIDSFDDNSSV